jgi:hypothetical protein
MTSESQGDKADGNRINFATLICALIAAGASIFGATASIYGTYSTNKSNAETAAITNKSNADTAALNRELNFFQTVVIPYHKDLQDRLSDAQSAFDEVCEGTDQLPIQRLRNPLYQLDRLGRSTPPGWDEVKVNIGVYSEFVVDSSVHLRLSVPAKERQEYQEKANGHRLALLDAIAKCYKETQPRRTDVK